MANTSFVPNKQGFRALAQSQEVLADLQRRAEAVSDAIGQPDLFIVDSQIGANRARASVRSHGFPGAIYEQQTHALETSMDAGAGDVT